MFGRETPWLVLDLLANQVKFLTFLLMERVI